LGYLSLPLTPFPTANTIGVFDFAALLILKMENDKWKMTNDQ
jgi:hypothetical protein